MPKYSKLLKLFWSTKILLQFFVFIEEGSSLLIIVEILEKRSALNSSATKDRVLKQSIII